VSGPEKQHLYVGQAKEIVRDDREPYIRLELDLTELKAKMEESHIRKWTSRSTGEHRTIALIVAPMKPENRTEFKTHSVKIDTWVPDKSKGRVREQPKPDSRPERLDYDAEDSGMDTGDVPF